jgi:PTH1 family peptidyl-tRNA hydrolase
MKLIVGLGNPGKEYDKTRHNIGFMILDDYIGEEKWTLKFNGLCLDKIINGEKVIFLKPQSYMNLSGSVVRKFVDYYNIELKNVLVIQDDLDMPIGRSKLISKHGDGGHNGIKDIILKLSSRDFLRVKIGIGKSNEMDTKDYVLGKFRSEDRKLLDKTFLRLRDIIIDYISMNRDSLIQKYNTKIQEE